MPTFIGCAWLDEAETLCTNPACINAVVTKWFVDLEQEMSRVGNVLLEIFRP